MRTEIAWPTDGEDAGTILIRQVGYAEGLGEYTVKTIRLPIEEAAELGAALLLAGQRTPCRPRPLRPLRLISARG